MNINWHVVNEVAQWIVIGRIWWAICSNNTTIMKTFSVVKKRLDRVDRKY